MTGDLETSAITWGGTRLPYAIRRSARRKKTVAVTVDPSGDVLLVAPENFSTSRLDAVVRRKAAWIVRRRRHVQSHDPPPSPREFVSGESIQYLGRHYRLKVHAYSGPSGTRNPGEVEQRIQRKWNTESGKWNTESGKWNIDSGGSGTAVPGIVNARR